MPVGRSPTRPSEGRTTHTTLAADEPPSTSQRENMEGDGDGTRRANIDAAQTVRLPPFWKDNPALWFAQVEAAFAIHRITGDESKFRYVILHADQSVLPFVTDLITNPPEQDKYQTLKERICSVLGETSATKIRRLLGSHELGDEKPSIFLQRLRNLAVGQVTDEILKSIFMEQLPKNVRSILANSKVQDLTKLAAHADVVVDMLRPASTAIQTISCLDKPKLNFPFLYTPQPPNLFCEFMKSYYLDFIMNTLCYGKEAEMINNLRHLEAWRLADQNYFYPWVCNRIAKHHIDSPEDNQFITLTQIDNKLDNLKSLIEKLEVPTSQRPQEHIIVAATLAEFRDQLVSRGAETTPHKPAPFLAEPLFPSRADESKPLNRRIPKPRFDF